MEDFPQTMKHFTKQRLDTIYSAHSAAKWEFNWSGKPPKKRKWYFYGNHSNEIEISPGLATICGHSPSAPVSDFSLVYVAQRHRISLGAINLLICADCHLFCE